jgi:hypothetical protein
LEHVALCGTKSHHLTVVSLDIFTTNECRLVEIICLRELGTYLLACLRLILHATAHCKISSFSASLRAPVYRFHRPRQCTYTPLTAPDIAAVTLTTTVWCLVYRYLVVGLWASRGIQRRDGAASCISRSNIVQGERLALRFLISYSLSMINLNVRRHWYWLCCHFHDPTT